MIHAFLAILQRVQEVSRHAHRLYPKTKTFEDVCSSSDSAVDVDLKLGEHLRALSAHFE